VSEQVATKIPVTVLGKLYCYLAVYAIDMVCHL